MPKSSRAAAKKQRRADRRQNKAHQQQAIESKSFPVPKRKPSTEPVVPRNQAQKRYDAAMRRDEIVFGIGPAGTGKTWLAAIRAAEALLEGEIERLYITRPAVEAGEKLGFLPGDLAEKYEPYLIPVRDALEERLGTGHFEYMLNNRIIVPRPVAFMRGLTFKDSWLIVDEAQNLTVTQMKMVLSRIGEGTRFIVNGDPRQIDIHESSGLIDAVDRLGGIDGVSVCRFGREDIVRSGMCQRVVEAYERD